MNNSVTIIGAGLAGSEAALTLADNGFKVKLYEMKPTERSPAHGLDSFCELVCNNSFCGINQKTPLNLLFEELIHLGSSLVPIIKSSLVNDTKSLAVDKRAFSLAVTEKIMTNTNINVVTESIKYIPENRPLIVATGALTSAPLLNELSKIFDGLISIQDSSCIVVDLGTIDTTQMEKISDDLFEIHLSKNEYDQLEENLANAVVLNQSVADTDLDFQQCKPVETLATIEKGLLRKTRLQTSNDIYAIISLRKDDRLNNSAVISGFTTRMTNKAQDNIVHSIKGLEKAKIVRYGRMHINSFIDSPRFISGNYEVVSYPDIYILGQLSGLDGYLAAVSSAVVACSSIIRKAQGLSFIPFPQDTVIGGLAKYVSTKSKDRFFPMMASFSLFSEYFNSDGEAFDYSKKIFEDWRITL
jgi:methylenetetrahydrofolate--tRNA-(uracil-5-)-methyltransferase